MVGGQLVPSRRNSLGWVAALTESRTGVLTELSHGVILDNEERLFSVRPEALRDALVRVYFWARSIAS